MGRPALSVKVLKDRGTYRSDRRKDNVQIEPSIPVCPKWLSGSRKKTFNRVAKFLHQNKMIGRVDAVALAMYCQALEDYTTSSKQLQESSLVLVENGKTSVNPLVKIKEKAWDQLLRLSKEFGLTPASRAKFEMVLEDHGYSDSEDFAD